MKTMRHIQSDSNIDDQRAMFAGDLFCEFQLTPLESGQRRRGLTHLFPGLSACLTAAAAAAWLADHYGFPVILLGLLIGASLNFMGDDGKAMPGLNFGSRYPLQLAIVLLGFQVSVQHVLSLGAIPFMALILVMLAAVLAAVIMSRFLRQPFEMGLLAGCATAICGASAALALFALMDRKRISDAHFAVTIAGISVASAAAMSIYPVLGHELGLGDREAGFLIGASIHDVAQAIGGGYAFSDAAGRYATIIKLTRVALLGPVVLLVGWILRRRDHQPSQSSRYAVPLFLLAFVAVAVAGSWLPVPDGVRSAALSTSKALLLIAVTATAMRTRLHLLSQVGLSGLAPVIAATVASFVTALLLCSL